MLLYYWVRFFQNRQNAVFPNKVKIKIIENNRGYIVNQITKVSIIVLSLGSLEHKSRYLEC